MGCDALSLAAHDSTGFSSQVRLLSVDIVVGDTPTVTISEPVVNDVVNSINDVTDTTPVETTAPPVIKVSFADTDQTTGGEEGTFGSKEEKKKDDSGENKEPKKEEPKQSRRAASCS